MSLSDPRFFAFLFSVFLVFYALPSGAARRLFLLAASYGFYFTMSKFYIGVLLFVTGITYGGALLLRSPVVSEKGRSGLVFGLGAVLILVPLLVLRYCAGVAWLFGSWQSALASLALPVGISFFSFAALGYLIDCYLEVVDPERDPVRVALFLAFFPVITAGPIERGGHFLPQLDLDRPFTAERGFAALRMILLGLFFKAVFAALLVKPVDEIFAHPARFSALEQLLGVVHYAFYIYADFAGYSLIAIGAARLLGLDVVPNFQQPFLSTTIPEFWRCWHMSLSFWVRDYMFAPLRMRWRRHPQIGTAAALFIAFVIIGVWHGPKWGYLWYGVIHGTYSIVSFFTLQKRTALWARLRVPAPLVHGWRMLCTFGLVLLAFVVWRADTIHDALGIYGAIFSFRWVGEAGSALAWAAFHVGHSPGFQAVGDVRCLGAIAGLLACDVLAKRGFKVETLPKPVQFLLYNAALLMVLSSWLNGHANQPFVYYKF